MRYEKNSEIKRKNILMLKKVMAAAVAFLIVFSIAAVDRSCAEACGEDEKIIPQIILESEGKVRIKSFLGDFSLGSQ